MTDKQINKWLRRRFSQVGWVLVAYYALMSGLAMMGMLWESLNQMAWAYKMGIPAEKLDAEAIMANAWGYIAAIGAGLAILSAWKGKTFWTQEILRKENPMRPAALGCMLILCMGAQMVNSFWVTGLELVMNCFGGSVMEILDSVSGDSNTLSMFLYASILAPLAEEILFRGYILRSLRPFGKRFAIFGSALLFGLFHGNLLQTPYAFLVGLILGYVTVEYSVGWAILIHVFNNLVLADLLTRLTASWSDLVYGIFNFAIFGGALALSIGILIRKRWEIRSYRCSEWMDRRVLKCFFLNSGILVMTVIALVNMISLLFV